MKTDSKISTKKRKAVIIKMKIRMKTVRKVEEMNCVNILLNECLL